jgi:pimeloyl-ACP methyl ester carboxylesterase
MRSSVDWMHAGLPADPLWGPLFYETMKNGRLINRVFPRVYTKEELAEIEAPVLVVLGEKELIYGGLDEAIEAGRNLIPGVTVALVPDAHHVAAVAQPEAVNREILHFFAG